MDAGETATSGRGRALEETLVADETRPDESGTSPGAKQGEDTLSPGTVIGRYVLVSRLGAGGMGEVWAGYDPELDRRIALKLLLRHRRTERARLRLLREAQALAKLSHPNVVAVFDVGTWRGQVWIAMEFVDGRTLGEWAAPRRHRWREVLDVVRSAGRGLAAAHAKGLVHRDLKPDNVMVDSEGRARVMDFGLARASEDLDEVSLDADPTSADPRPEDSSDERLLDSTLTIAGAMMGTPAYMAPELFSGAEAGARADQFAYCVTVWEVLFGERPFAGNTVHEIALAITAGDRREPTTEVHAPTWVRRVIERGLATEPSERWESMDALLDALDRDPARRRRAGSVALALVGVLAAAIGWQRLERSRVADDCARDGEALAQVWSEDARTRTRAAFLATDLAYAEETWSKTAVRLDGYVEDWSRLRESVCRETRVLGTRSEPSLDRAEACLEERRAALASLVESLEVADAARVRGAISSVASLPPVGQCTDDAWLSARLPPPDDPIATAEVARIRTGLSRVGVLVDSGRLDDARTEVEALRVRAEAIGWPPIVAEVDVVAGMTYSRGGDYELARTTLERAFVSAARAGHDEVAASAAGWLVHVVGGQQADHELGLQWGTVGAVFVSRAGAEGSLTEARLFNALGLVERERGEIESAREYTVAAHDIWAELLGERSPQVAAALNNIGSLHNSLGERDTALDYYERSLSMRGEVLGAHHPDLASVLNNIGNVHLARGDYQAAYTTYTRAFEIREAAYGREHPATAFSMNNVGTAALRLGRYDEAVSTLKETAAIRESVLGPEHPHLATTLHNLGFTYLEMREPEQALPQLERSATILEVAYGSQHVRYANALDGVGRALAGLGRYEEAIDRFDRALALLEGAGREDSGTANTLVAQAQALASAGRWDDARAAVDRALDIFAAGEPTPREWGAAQFALARVLWAEGAYDEAERARERAVESSEAAGAEARLVDIEAWSLARPPRP